LSNGAGRLAARFPHVWHVIEADGNGPWLNEIGLLPAAELCRLAGLERDGSNRDDFHRIDLGLGRIAILRLQQMRDDKLLPTLAGGFTGRPDLWRQHIDRHVFFWATTERRYKFIAATQRDRARSGLLQSLRPPVIIAVDTEALLRRTESLAYFARFNTGSTVLGGAQAHRDETAFLPVSEYRSGKVAELAIRGRVELAGIIVGASPAW